jgi:Protein of unknown function (DUF1190)
MTLLRFPFAAVLVAAIALGGCGNAEEPKATAPPPEHGIFTSAIDCAGFGKLTVDQCGHAIDRAVTAHQAQAPLYKSLNQCEATEGPERCDKVADREYRPRIQAFLVTMSDPATAVQLYAPHGSTAAFRSPSRQEIAATDESMNVSREALTVANENAKLPSPVGVDTGAALGAAAGNIH